MNNPLHQTYTRKRPSQSSGELPLLLTLTRSSADVILRHAPRQTADVVLQREVLALQPVVVVAHELDAFSDFEQAELGLAGVSGSG